MTTNPFKPMSGAVPPLLVGREAALAELADSFDNGPGAPARLALFTGARGVGKTVMLTETELLARRRGWATVAGTANKGLIGELVAAIGAAATDFPRKKKRASRVRGVTLPSVLGVGGGGIELAGPAAETPVGSFRAAMNQLLDLVEPAGVGVLVTVDEVHGVARDDLRQVAIDFQHLVRDGRNVALALAGLPAAITDLLNDHVLTFLRRAVPFHLGRLDTGDVAAALRATIEDGGRGVSDEALALMTDAVAGYPFMLQLVGYYTWRQATGEEIDVAAAEGGIPIARDRLGSAVLATALADVSPTDRAYVSAMAQDEGPSRTGEIADRLGFTAARAGQHRARLIAAGIIEPAGHGLVDLSLPFLRAYARAHLNGPQLTP
ncbi:MAG: AAA family ATPase [Bifidobacteriaceae bacterium]|nr:AAA family ATPase [Bifidobacteriaceae bacterium]